MTEICVFLVPICAQRRTDARFRFCPHKPATGTFPALFDALFDALEHRFADPPGAAVAQGGLG
ncbi:MAG: hypothetical protein GDA36_12760 [Rhodobacteraceae bacterium]|nr:hypothetical protein [Paracoccaceae bacterium]